MGHKRLQPVDVVMQMLKFSPCRAEHYSGKVLKRSGKYFPLRVAENSFSIYHANTVGLTTYGAQFKRL
jgi:hypothetical protein